jgi:transcription elongation factor GreA
MAKSNSKEAVKNLEKKLEKLLKEREEVIERLSQTSAFGDLTENAEYQQAREDKERLDQEILRLKGVLQKLKGIKASKNLKEEIGLYSKVKAKSGKKIIEFTIVPSEEMDIPKKLFSIESPFAKAFLKKKKGDKVKFKTPGGKEREYLILEVK